MLSPNDKYKHTFSKAQSLRKVTSVLLSYVLVEVNFLHFCRAENAFSAHLTIYQYEEYTKKFRVFGGLEFQKDP